METGFSNGAQLSASNAETWTQWSMVLKGLKWMAAPIAQIPNYRANMAETVRLAPKSREALYETAEREGIDFHLEKHGVMHFHSTEADLAHGRKVKESPAEDGLERRDLAGVNYAGSSLRFRAVSWAGPSPLRTARAISTDSPCGWRRYAPARA